MELSMIDEIKKELDSLSDKLSKIADYLKLDEKKKILSELKKETESSGLWNDSNRAKKILKEISSIEKDINEWQSLKEESDDLHEIISFSKDEDEKEIDLQLRQLLSRASKLELHTLLSGEYDKSNAVLSINAGAGGTDAQDWAQILLRMYSRWAEGKGYKIDIPELSYGDEAGIKSATLIVNGEYAYGYLKGEKGVHRLVRLSPFNSDGKRHTSFAAVEVIPEISEEIEVTINPADLRVDTYRASGPGGQNVNKTSSAVRITHLPTGIVTQSQSDRNQQANKEICLKVLKSKLYEMMLAQRKEKIEELRGERKAIEWGHQIRSYVFQPYTMVKDNRTGTEVGNVEAVINGDIDVFIEAMLKKA